MSKSIIRDLKTWRDANQANAITLTRHDVVVLLAEIRAVIEAVRGNLPEPTSQYTNGHRRMHTIGDGLRCDPAPVIR